MNPFLILRIFIYGAAAATRNHSAISSTMTSQSIDYDSELQDAARTGDARRVQDLLASSGANPAANNNHAVSIAAENGHTGCVKLLLADPRVNPADGSNRALAMAACNGHPECVRLLLADERVDPATRDNFPIVFAAKNGHGECVKLLLADSRVNPGARDNFAIGDAAQYGHTECVKLLLADPRVNPAADNNWAIRIAAGCGHMKCVKLLLADPRVEPSVDSRIPSSSKIRSLIDHIRTCKDGDLKAFKAMNPTALSDDVLDIFIARNRLFPEVHRYLLGVQVAYLAVPETVHDDPTFETCINSARSRGLWRTGELREAIKTFIRLKRHAGFPSDLAVIIAAHSCNPVA